MMMMILIIEYIAIQLCMREINISDQTSKPEMSFSHMEQNCWLLNAELEKNSYAKTVQFYQL